MNIPVKLHRPEDTELSRKLAELAKLQTRLADLELQLVTLRLDLGEFEKLYYSKVSALYAELDEVEALIAEQLAQRRPLDRKFTEAASDARARADESRRVAESAGVFPLPVERSSRLKDLYRAAAKQLHPDLAQDENDRIIRERLMTEANLAYASGDENKLEAVLEEYQSSPDTVRGSDVGAELIRNIRRISLTQTSIRKVEAKLDEIKASEIYKLKATVDEEQQRNKDILSELAERLRHKIRDRRQYLQTL